MELLSALYRIGIQSSPLHFGVIHKAFGTRVYMNTTYYQHTNDQSEMTTQNLKDMFRDCVFQWDEISESIDL